MNNKKSRALLVSISTVAIFLACCFLLVALIDKFPIATMTGVGIVATALMGRSIYKNELNRLDSEDVESKEA